MKELSIEEKAIRELWRLVDICRKGSLLDKEDKHE